MTDRDVDEFVSKAESIYATRLRNVLEPKHLDEFVAIEPESGDYFLGKTLSEATRAARQAYPGRLTHAMRVGHKAALHFNFERLTSCSIRCARLQSCALGLAYDECR